MVVERGAALRAGAEQQQRSAAAITDASPRAGHCAQHEPLPTTTVLPGKSLYNLQVSLTDQHGTAFTFASFRGRPLLVTMFYASCTTVCPMLIEQLRQTDNALTSDLRAQTRVLLISLDPEHDTVERLAELAKLHDIKSDRWHFTRSPASSVPEVAALLGVSYRRLPDGAISHSASLSLLDRDGVLIMQQDGLRGDPMEIAKALRRIAGLD